MADTKLTVSMILNNASFTKQIQDVNKQLKLVESEFKSAGAGVENFEKTTTGLQTKLATLTSKFDLQKTKIEKYRAEIAKTKTDLDDTVSKYDKNKKKIEEVSEAYEEACEVYGKNSEEAKKLKEELEGLTKKHTNYENKIISTNSRLTTLETELNNAEKEAKELGQQIDETSKELDNFATDSAKANLKAYGESMQEAGSRIENVGKGFSEVAKKMAVVSVPLIGMGTASVKTAMTFEQGMSKVKAASGATSEELALLEQKARDVAKTSTKTATDCVDALGNLALAGYGTQDMLNALDPVIKMAEAGMLDLETASDLCVNAMSTLGKDSSELEGFLDVIAQTANATTTDIDGMMEAFINVGSTIKGLNMPFQEAAAVLGVLGQNGTRGYEAGTKLNSILTRITSQSKIAAGAWDKLGVKVFDGNGKFRGLTTVLNETREKLKGYNDEQTQVFLKAVVGTDNINDFKNMVDSTGGTLEGLTDELYNCDGALNEMTETMKDNVAGQWATVKSQMEELGLKIADTLLPMFSKLLTAISKATEWFDGLPEPMQQAIVYAGLFVVSLNALIGALGGLITAYGSVYGALGKMLISFATGEGAIASMALKITGKMGLTSALTGAGTAAATTAGATGMGALIGSLGTFAAAAAPWIAAATGIYLAGQTIYKGLQEEVIPEVDLFADKVETTSQVVATEMGAMTTNIETEVTKISDATKQAVGAYIELDNEITKELFNMQLNSTTITKEIATNMTNKFNNMGEQIKEGFKKHSEDNIATLTTFFTDSKALSDKEEKEILAQSRRFYKQRMDDVDIATKRIKEILDKASKENRELNEQECAEISSIRETLKSNAVQALSQQELESKVIVERMKSYNTRMTAEMVSENIKKLNEERDKTKKEADKKYEEVVRAATILKDDLGTITEDQYDKMVEDAKKQRDETVKAAEETRKKAVKEISGMAGTIMEDVDEATGEILTDWQKVARWWNEWRPKEKVLSVINKIGEVITGTTYASGSSGGKKSKIIESFDFGDTSMNLGSDIPALSDNLYIPTPNEMNDMTRGLSYSPNNLIGSARSDSSQIITTDNSQELQTLINLNQSLIGLVQQLVVKDNNVYLDGREVARGIAPYKTEFDRYDTRNPRFAY